jgi:copper chaperone NosL
MSSLFPFLNKINMNTLKISVFSRVALIIVSVLFFFSLLFPMWQIELSAPQYPEGLVLKLHANKIGGDVEIINGLNHYIGMATLHTENFIEFKVLPYIMLFFGLFSLLMVFVAKRKGVLFLFFTFILFGFLAGVDFYRWNYEYGHNLDPNAAIIVPGMAYQPPLIGYKQLLNFGAYSIPDIGGWMLIAAGLLLGIILVKEFDLLKRFKSKNKQIALLILVGFFTSCSSKEPEPIKLNVDQCSFCKMSISDGRFGSELITKKGRIYKFDDIVCLTSYVHQNPLDAEGFYVNDYATDNTLIPAETAYFIKGEQISSPMRGNIAAFASEKEAAVFMEKLETKSITWNNVLNP